MDLLTTLALLDLHHRTPSFFVAEMFRHGDVRTLRDAHEILHRGIDPLDRSTAVLRAMMEFLPESPG